MNLIYACSKDVNKGENRTVNVHTTRFLCHELGPSHMPQRRSVIQAGKNIFYPRPYVAVFEPTQLNGLPQLVAESKIFCPLRFPRSDPLHNIVDSEDI